MMFLDWYSSTLLMFKWIIKRFRNKNSFWKSLLTNEILYDICVFLKSIQLGAGGWKQCYPRRGSAPQRSYMHRWDTINLRWPLLTARLYNTFLRSSQLSGKEPKGENQRFTPEGVLLPKGVTSSRDNLDCNITLSTVDCLNFHI